MEPRREPDESSQHTCLRSVLISSDLHLDLPGNLFPLGGFLNKTLYAVFSHTATCPVYRSLIDLIILVMFCQEKLLISSLRSFLHFPVTSPLLGPEPCSQTPTLTFL